MKDCSVRETLLAVNKHIEKSDPMEIDVIHEHENAVESVREDIDKRKNMSYFFILIFVTVVLSNVLQIGTNLGYRNSLFYCLFNIDKHIQDQDGMDIDDKNEIQEQRMEANNSADKTPHMSHFFNKCFYLGCFVSIFMRQSKVMLLKFDIDKHNILKRKMSWKLMTSITMKKKWKICLIFSTNVSI